MQDKTHHFLQLEVNSSEIRRPAFCCINISQVCMLRCKMCFTWKNKYERSQEEPTLNEWYNFIHCLGDLTNNSTEINVSGGEPLLDERNLELIRFAAKRGFSTSMTTNGFLINSDTARKIVESGLDVIAISLDGFNKKTHDFLRGVEGCYDKAMKAIDYLDRIPSKLKIGIMAIILDKNLDEIIELTKMVHEDKRLVYISFQALVQPFSSPYDKEWYRRGGYSYLWPQDIKKVHAVVDELIRLKEIGYEISNPVSQLKVFKRYFENPYDFIKMHKCNVDFYMNIDRFGNTYICALKESVGNIKKDSIKEIWYSAKSNKIREEMVNCKVNCHHLLNCFYEEE